MTYRGMTEDELDPLPHRCKPSPIALELLEQERERLLRDHYDTVPSPRTTIECSGCLRAIAVRAEIETLERNIR